MQRITDDSRIVQYGDIFAAINGTIFNGENFINDAIKNGATTILCRSGLNLNLPDNIRLIEVKNPRIEMAKLAAKYYALIPENIIAITGTDGKTSTAEFIRQFWQLEGKNGASIGTIGIFSNEGKIENTVNTTPSTIKLRQILCDLREQNIDNVAIEASSHGLHQYRLDGVKINAAIFTNFANDHGDYHIDRADYFKAKLRLFKNILPDMAIAVLNADDDEVMKLANFCKMHHNLRSFGKAGEYIKILSTTANVNGIEAEILANGKQYKITIPLYGEFQLLNIAAALCVLPNLSEAIANISYLKPISGRMERIRKYKNAQIFIDYAHTAQALQNALISLKKHISGKLILVFGCGGDRDKAKRPLMGAVAEKFADITIITDDNPRGENPAEIRHQIKYLEAKKIADRAEAIKYAANLLNDGDALLIAGKGHENTQIIGKKTHHFSDKEEILAL